MFVISKIGSCISPLIKIKLCKINIITAIKLLGIKVYVFHSYNRSLEKNTGEN